MFRTRIRQSRLIVLAVCFVGLFVFSAIIPLDNSTTVVEVTPEDIQERHTQSTLDFSTLWNRTYGGLLDERFYDMTVCADGGYAFTGRTESFTEPIGNYDIWVVRTDNEGNVLWSKLLGANSTLSVTGMAITECENGDFAVVGRSYPAGDYEARIDRLDADGNILWTREIGTVANNDYFVDVIEGSSGCLVAVGRSTSWGAGNDDVLVICFDPNGNEIWFRTYGGASGDAGTSVIECSAGGYAILGTTYSFGEGFTDLWLLRIDQDGNLLWEETYGGTDSEFAAEVIECTTGGFIMAGGTESLGDPNGDIWAIRVDTSGVELWNTTFPDSGQDVGTGIVESVNGGFAVLGISDFISGVDQTRISRLDIDGTELWSEWYGGPNVDYGYSIHEISPEEFVVGGTTRSYGSGEFDGWVFLVPGEPRLIDPLGEVHIEFGLGAGAILWAESTAPIHMWWLEDTSVFNIVKIGDNEGSVYRLLPPDVGYYEVGVHVNNTAGHETEHIFFIYVDDTTTPYWTDFTAEYTLEFGDQFQYSPRAADLSLLGDWFLTGSSYFTIDMGNGEITNVGTPPVGIYNLEIQVNDMYHNSLFDDLQIVVQDTTAPTWVVMIEDQIIDYGEDFVYDIDANDIGGIASWFVSSSEFSIDSEGRVRNMVTLAPGVHSVIVTVTDVNGNELQGTFTVTVGDRPTTTTQPTTPSGGTPDIIDSAILFGAGVGATLLVVAVVCAMGRRKPSGSK